MTQEWLYRVMSKETAEWCFQNNQNQRLQFDLKHPIEWAQWGPERNDSGSGLPIVMDESVSMENCNFLDVRIPKSNNLPDPLEGIIFEGITLLPDEGIMNLFGCKSLSSKIRSICFSYAECTEQQLGQLIEQALCRYSATAYIYAPFDDMIQLFTKAKIILPGLDQNFYSSCLFSHPVRYLIKPTPSKVGSLLLETPSKDPKSLYTFKNWDLKDPTFKDHVNYVNYISDNLRKLWMYRDEQEQRITAYIQNVHLPSGSITCQCDYSRLNIKTGWGIPTL